MEFIDITFLRWVNSWVGVSEWSDTLIIFSAEWLIWWLTGFLAIFWIFGKDKHREFWLIAKALVAAVFSRFIVAEIIRYFYDRPRPFEVLNLYGLMDHPAGGSFPSGHAAYGFAIAAMVYFHYPKTGAAFFLIAIAIGFSRVAAGIHWPSDILGGAIVGIFSAWLVKILLKKLKVNSISYSTLRP